MPGLIRTARETGLFYLGLAVTGVFGFLIVRPRLLDSDNPVVTLGNLVDHETLAQVGIALESILSGVESGSCVTSGWEMR